MAENLHDLDELSSQIVEEEDLFLDEHDFPDDEETNEAMLALAAAEEPALDTTLRTRLAGPSSHKAGLDEVDKEQVNRIIYEASKGSSFFENERKKDAATTKRIEALLVQYEKIRHNDLSLETRIVDHMLHDMESKRDLTQVICHVDMDAFYASVEELERPELKQVPMAVGSIGMLCTSNYIARKYGVRSAMPGYIALKLCPSLQIIPLHFPKYRAASAKVRAIFAKYDPHFCPMSLDEAYLNLTEYLKTSDLNPAQLVEKIRQEIFEETQLTASAGIAANRMLAKVCSDINKPNGQFYLPNDQEAIFEFVDPLRIRKVPGIGRVTERILEALEVKTCGDVYRQRAILYKLLSPINFKFMLKCHLGIGSTTISEETVRKSISVERTFRAISDTTLLMEKVDELAVLLAQDLAKSNVEGKTITIKLKLTTFELRTRAKTIPAYTSQTSDITRIAREELPVNLRLMGLRMSNLRPRGQDDQGVKKYFLAANASIPCKRPLETETETEATQTETGTEEEKEALTCPVCNQTLLLDNASFNQHIDECLSKVEVKAILQSEPDYRSPQVTESSRSNSHSRSPTCSSSSRKRSDTSKSLLDYYSPT